jgi:cytochrome c-type biogenesis protein CcmF
MSVTGYVALFLALAASLYAAIIYLAGANVKNRGLIRSARAGLLLAGGLITLSVIVLLIALLAHDFQLNYVASYTSRGMPPVYIVSALWAGNDGSMLFWVWFVAIFAVVVVLQRRDRGRELVPYAAGIMMLVQSFFLILLLAAANPFQTLAAVPADGRGLNPMLENPGMILHPPALLVGYVALMVPFAFAVATLLGNRTGGEWLAAARRWALLAWLLLGVGNIIGAWWAYVELGWGGYWAWDPVENAGLMPWLVITAFLHSTIVQRRKGMFKAWTMVLVILAFSLSIFGTYINRSGVLSSVHTYGESALGPFFLVFLIIVVIGSLGLLYYRKDGLKSEAEVEVLLSRESTFLLNNILLIGATAVIFFGTVFPGISEAISGARIEVGRAFFDRVNGPVFLAVILLAGLCTLIGWRSATAKKFLANLAWPAAGAVVLSLILFILGVREGYAIVGGFICGLVFFAVLYRWFQEAREYRSPGRGNVLAAGVRLFGAARSRYGGYLVHLAIVIIAVGVIGSSVYNVSKDVVLKQGQAASIKGYRLVYEGLSSREVPDKQIITATLDVYRGDNLITTMTPEKYFHRSFQQPVSEVAIHTTPLEDLYVALSGWDENGTASFSLLVNPLVVWLWIGGGVFLLGGLIAFWPGRRREALTGEPTAPASLDEEIERRVRELRRRPERTCPRCGAPFQPGDRFCSRCGENIGEVVKN